MPDRHATLAATPATSPATSPAPPLQRLATVKFAENRGLPRVWVEGRYLLRAGFAPGAVIEAAFEPGRVVLRLEPEGSRHVSRKLRKGEAIPVIDINSIELRTALGAVERLEVRVATGEIVITPARTEGKRQTRCRNGKEGALFAGGGLLSEAARLAGYEPAFAVELDPVYADIFHANHPTAQIFNASIAEVPVDALPPVELLTIGIPCEAFSTARSQDRGTGAVRDKSLPPEAHPHGDMTFWALRIIDALNPAQVLIEEVPGYLQSGASWVLRHALTRMGYTVAARVLDARDYGALTARRRAVILATTDGPTAWPEPQARTRTFGEIMEPVAAIPADAWFTPATKPWVFQHEADQRAKGRGYVMRRLTAASTEVPTLTKRYFAGQGSTFIVPHPTAPDTYRWLTITEAKRLQGVREDYDLGAAKTRAGEVLGQAVSVDLFRHVLGALHGAPADAAIAAPDAPRRRTPPTKTAWSQRGGRRTHPVEELPLFS